MSNSGYKKCFNSECVDFKSRKGWRLRSGDFADLCDRCASAYEEGRFCDMFHSNATGWRCCETCGKRLHCGCIVSVHAFTLLDSGGVECMTCARKKIVLTTNSTWSSSLFCNTPSIERLKDLSIRSQSPLAGPGPVPWRQASTLFGSSISQSEVQSRTLYEGDRLINLNEKLSGPSSLEKGKFEDVTARLMNGKLKLGSLDVLENGFAGKNREEQRSWVMAKAQQTSCLREDSSAPNFGMVLYPSMIETNSRSGGTPLAKQIHGNLHNGVDASADTQIRNGKSRADSRGRNQLPRYSPRITDEELLQISGNSNSVITPLFEKMLSASDAGRIGRLVLPKKCAEAYFPPISQPEGLPLKVQDCKGKEWIFQFRFWPNNNSRMYVLEGVTPCIQNMQLQAGDTVTFSRLEPEGKLVMGFRKASTAPPSDQDKETTSKTGNSSSTNGEFETADPSPKYRVDKSGYIAKEVLEAKASTKRRKSSTLGSRNKRLRIENEDVLELKLTWEEAQGLLRPPDDTPNVVVIEGFEFEEYEDAPVLGKPTIFATDDQGEKVQWAQCEACSKWRKLPASALLASKWSCSGNSWDPERSSCSAAQELTAEQLEDLLPSGPKKKMKSAKQEPDDDEALEGLDTLANLAILGEDEELPASAQTTTKHPRHRPGCSCIVCIQPPSGKGPKHKPTCACNVCQSVRRRFKTMMMKREKKQSDKEAESTENKQQPPLPEASVHNDCGPSSDPEISSPKKITGECSNDDPNISRNKSSTSPFKGQIDLNLQPERDEEFSPNSESGAMMNMSLVADDRGEQQKYLSSDGNNNLTGNQILAGREGTENKIVDGIGFGGGHHDADKDHTVTFSTIASTDAPATG